MKHFFIYSLLLLAAGNMWASGVHESERIDIQYIPDPAWTEICPTIISFQAARQGSMINFYLTCEIPRKCGVCFFNPPSGSIFGIRKSLSFPGLQEMRFSITAEQLNSSSQITVHFYKLEKNSDDDRIIYGVFITPEHLLSLKTQLFGTPVDPIKNMKDDPIDEETAAVQLEALKSAQTGDVVTFTNIIFYPDQAVIKEESCPILEAIAQFLISNPDISVELRGYTNALGTPDQEQELSRARAEAVKSFMLKKGIASYRIVTVGYGSLFARRGDVVEANRRVEIKILSRGD